MKIALTSDEPYPVHERVVAEVRRRGHEPILFGSLVAREAVPWTRAAEEAALAVSQGRCDEGIFFCWTGTGISMAANKVPGVRAALCVDPGTAAGARVWNHANVLCLSNRLLSEDMAKEILAAWFDTSPGPEGAQGVSSLIELDARYRRAGAE